MNTSTTRRGTSFRWLAVLGLALMILPALSSDSSAQYYRRGGFYGRGYGGFGPRYYGRGYASGPRVYSRGYGFAPRSYGSRYGGFYNSGVPFRGGYRSPFYGPGFRMGFGGYPY